jgi:hypothetical protein
MAKYCATVLRRQPAVIAWVLAGVALSSVLVLGLLALILGRLPNANDLQFPKYLSLYPAFVIGGLPMTYANAVVLVAADGQMRGAPASLSDCIRTVNRRLPALLAWSLLAGTVGLLFQILESRLKIGGRLLTWLVGLSWGVATSLVVPCLVFEDVNPVQAVRRSAHLFKERWGINVRARVATGAWSFLIVLGFAVIMGIAFAVSPVVGVVTVVCGAILMGATFGALQTVLTAALYRYSADGALVDGLTAADLDSAFRKRGRRSQRQP